jgi:acylphosphatase
LSGWVRNLKNGNVEAVAHGPRAGVEALIAACQAGPVMARVTAVNTEWIAKGADTADGRFEQRETA